MRETARAPQRDTSAAPPIIENDVAQPARVLATEDRVRWGPVWAGLFTALTTFLLLELLAYGVGWFTTVNASGAVVASGAAPWISGAFGLVTFFLGGFIAERASAARGGMAGLLNGFMVWALGTGLILLLSILGLGSLFGALGNVVGQFLASGQSIATPGSVNAAQVIQVTQSSAIGAFFTLLVFAAAATLGGLLGAPGGAAGRLSMGRWR